MILHRLASMACSLSQVKFTITTPDPLQPVTCIGNTLDWIITNSFATVGGKNWKSIPENLRKLPKHAFRKQIHNPLLLDLQRQDGYANIDTHINAIKKGSS